MRKIVSIPLVMVILLTGITVNLASHYCGETFISSKVSLDGKLTSCGMEPSIPDKPGINKTDHDCQDFISAYTFSGSYLPSHPENVNFALDIPDENPCYTLLFSEPSDNCHQILTRPPGLYIPSDIKLEAICIFLI